MKRTLMVLLLGSLISFSMPAWSYDTEMAQGHAALFSQVNAAKADKMLHFMKPEGFVKAVHSGKTIVPIDVRTTAVGTALRHIGLNNVYILKGGFQTLARLYGPKQAYPKPTKE